MQINSLDTKAEMHLLLPENMAVAELLVNGISTSFSIENVGGSVYLNFNTHIVSSTSIEVKFQV